MELKDLKTVSRALTLLVPSSNVQASAAYAARKIINREIEQASPALNDTDTDACPFCVQTVGTDDKGNEYKFLAMCGNHTEQAENAT